MNNKTSLFTLLIFSIVGILPYINVSSVSAQHNHENHSTSTKEEIWTCSMHPNIRLPKPGQCPICHMDLILTTSADTKDRSASSSNQKFEFSDYALKLADIQTTPVLKKAVTNQLNLSGILDFDETRLAYITAWVAGRIDRMFVDYTGIRVNKGDHMVELYSPDLISAQEELIQNIHSLKRMKNSNSQLLQKSTAQSVAASKEKLLQFGLTEQQIKDIETRNAVRDKITIYSPHGGIVVEKNVAEGMYVQTGTNIYSIADLSQLWVTLNAYESDLPWIRYGQKVTFSTQALPGVTFTGQISFISPVLDKVTRTTKVRVNVPNGQGLLKPGMFINANIASSSVGYGKVIDNNLIDQYICPMHPDIHQQTPGNCSICGMKLVTAESLGYTANTNTKLPLIIPESAPLITGKRTLVYVKDKKTSHFELRNIILGPKVTGYYIVESGLSEGELVVTKGAFKIDADLQIKGQKSMMNMEDQAPSMNHHQHSM